MKKHRHTLTILFAYAGFIALGAYGGLIGVAWPSIRDEFALGNDAFGLLIGAGTVGHVAASFANGWMFRRGVGFILIFSMALKLTGALVQIVGAWEVLLFGALLMGLGGGMIDSGLNTYAAASFRPRLLNWLHASFALGSTLGAAWMGAVISRALDWRVGVGILVGLFAVMLVVYLFTRTLWQVEQAETDEATHTMTAGDTPKQAGAMTTLLLPVVLMNIVIFLLYGGVEVGVGNWNFTLFTESRGFDTERATLLAGLYWGSFTAGRVLLGFIETNLSRLIRLAMFGTLLGVVLLLFSDSDVAAFAAIILTGAAQAPVFPALVALTPDRVGRQHAANAIGYQVGAAGIGIALIPSIAGIMAEQISLESIVPLFVGVTMAMIALNEVLERMG